MGCRTLEIPSNTKFLLKPLFLFKPRGFQITFDNAKATEACLIITCPRIGLAGRVTHRLLPHCLVNARVMTLLVSAHAQMCVHVRLFSFTIVWSSLSALICPAQVYFNVSIVQTGPLSLWLLSKKVRCLIHYTGWKGGVKFPFIFHSILHLSNPVMWTNPVCLCYWQTPYSVELLAPPPPQPMDSQTKFTYSSHSPDHGSLGCDDGSISPVSVFSNKHWCRNATPCPFFPVTHSKIFSALIIHHKLFPGRSYLEEVVITNKTRVYKRSVTV